MSTGSIAANFHEGSRSEYLAQYIFASFGTAVAVPHQEDAGIDLYCTITERVGQRAWPRAHLTVQVKSSESILEFQGEDSVRWLIEHPLPLFLCVVDKKSARLKVFQTSSRLIAGFPTATPKWIRLRPGATVEAGGDWRDNDIALHEAILDYSVQDFLDDESASLFRDILLAWTSIDAEMIRRRAMGIRSIATPEYATNQLPRGNVTGRFQLSATLRPETVGPLVDILEHLGEGLAFDFAGAPAGRLPAVLVNMLHRSLTKGDMASIHFLNTEINAILKRDSYVFDGVDYLLRIVGGLIAGDGMISCGSEPGSAI